MGEIKHAIQRTVSVASVLAAAFLIGLGLYMGYITFIKPHFNPEPTTRQTAEQIQNYEYHYSKPDDRLFLGISLWGWRLGFTWVGKQGIVENK